jgi:hypothetical protein
MKRNIACFCLAILFVFSLKPAEAADNFAWWNTSGDSTTVNGIGVTLTTTGAVKTGTSLRNNDNDAVFTFTFDRSVSSFTASFSRVSINELIKDFDPNYTSLTGNLVADGAAVTTDQAGDFNSGNIEWAGLNTTQIKFTLSHNGVGNILFDSFDVLSAPAVTTQAVTDIATTTATGNGNVTLLGAANLTQHGVCWSTSPNPTIALPTKTEQGVKNTTGVFTSNITGLSPNTTYYVRAYATNSEGTSYGGQVSFDNTPTTLSTGNPSAYEVTVTKVEMWNGISFIVLFSGSAELDMVIGGTFPGIDDVALPAGTYSKIKVTFNNGFPVTGMASYSGTDYYTTSAVFGGETNLASTPTTTAGSAAEFIFRNPAWGALNVDVEQEYDITPITVGEATDYQPILRFTITNTVLLKGNMDFPATYFLSLDPPTGSIVEP